MYTVPKAKMSCNKADENSMDSLLKNLAIPSSPV